MFDSKQQEPPDPKDRNPDYQLIPKAKETSNLEKIVTGILQLFGRQKPKTELHFVEVMRIQDTANKLLTQLREMKSSVEGFVDEELSSHIKTVITTMDQGITSIHDLLKEKTTYDIARQVKVYELYAQWIIEARPWLLLLSEKIDERETIIKYAASYISAERIERDIRSIRNYPSYELAEKYRSQLEEALRISMKKLQGLKYLPEDLTLEELNSWKAEVNHCRGEFYDEALRIIDRVIRKHEGESH